MWTVMESPIGDLRIVERDGKITQIEFSPFRDQDGDDHRDGRDVQRQGAAVHDRKTTRSRPIRWNRPRTAGASRWARSP